MTDWDRAWPAPAKINLFLHVVGRRADGYHLLQTVFRFIDLADILRCEPRNDGRIVLANPLPGVPPETDLVVRAAQALRAATGATAGVSLHLEKRLPMGGGLGGGSSDAATTLLALNRCGAPDSTRGLAAHRPHAGCRRADLHPRAQCLRRGRRRAFYRCRAAAGLVSGGGAAGGVPTPEIFRSPQLRRDTPAIAAADWHPGFGHNDLEAVACSLYPEMARHLDWLRTPWRCAHERFRRLLFCRILPDECTAQAALRHPAGGMQGLSPPESTTIPCWSLAATGA
jgi:4-diphosphocytidyl-2-C-methyl-D-erythritol kinase